MHAAVTLRAAAETPWEREQGPGRMAPPGPSDEERSGRILPHASVSRAGPWVDSPSGPSRAVLSRALPRHRSLCLARRWYQHGMLGRAGSPERPAMRGVTMTRLPAVLLKRGEIQ